VEVVLFIVVVSVALVVVLKAFEIANVGSADPVLRRQSLAIAQGLLEEIRFKPFGSAATDDVLQGGFAGPYTPANRQYFDDVDDYNGFTMTGITTLGNVALTGLGSYNASVAVTQATFGNVPASGGWRITVTVTDPAGRSISLDGYRADY
jgi:MSHA pilin protein MshD